MIDIMIYISALNLIIQNMDLSSIGPFSPRSSKVCFTSAIHQHSKKEIWKWKRSKLLKNLIPADARNVTPSFLFCLLWSLVLLPGSNVHPKILPFCCKRGRGKFSMGVNWSKAILFRGRKMMQEFGCNESIFEELPPWLKLQRMSGLQWAAMAGLLRNYAPWLKFPSKIGLQWEDFSGISPW